MEETSVDRLRGIITRVEELETERKEITDDIKAVMQTAKSDGFDLDAIREVLKRRRRDRGEVDAIDSLVSLYEQNLG